MKPLDLNFICQALKLPMPSESKPVSRIVTDSRDIRAGDVFSHWRAGGLMRMILLKTYWLLVRRRLWFRAKIALQWMAR